MRPVRAPSVETSSALVPAAKAAAEMDFLTLTEDTNLMFEVIEWFARQGLSEESLPKDQKAWLVSLAKQAKGKNSFVARHAKAAHEAAVEFFKVA